MDDEHKTPEDAPLLCDTCGHEMSTPCDGLRDDDPHQLCCGNTPEAGTCVSCCTSDGACRWRSRHQVPEPGVPTFDLAETDESVLWQLNAFLQTWVEERVSVTAAKQAVAAAARILRS